MIEIDVICPSASYPIYIGDGILAEVLQKAADFFPSRRAMVVSDETVWALHGDTLSRDFAAADISLCPVIVPPGEKSKSMANLELLYHAFCRFELKRNEPVIAVGGGVIGDLAGFAAATYMRGVPFVQIPTTLLAQVDSSVGGKVAVNLAEGKNLIGSFYQPGMVIVEPSFLKTLPRRELASGMAEVIKYAMIGCEELLHLLESLTSMDEVMDHMSNVIALCCRAKAAVVEQDERDNGPRMILNFGHTFGHAIEKYYAFERYNHGEAVAIGMVLAAQTGLALSVTEQDILPRLLPLLKLAGLETKLDGNQVEILRHMALDKKNSGSKITLVLLENIGKPIIHKITPEALMNLLEKEC